MTEQGKWSFTFRLPNGELPCVGGKPSDLYDNTIYATDAHGSSRNEAEQRARKLVAKRGKTEAALNLTGCTPLNYRAVELDGKLDP